MSGKIEPSYEIVFEKRERYLYARVNAARLTSEIIFDFLTDILMEAARVRRRRILLDRDIPVPPPTGGAQDAWNHFLKVVQGQRIAIYNPNPGITGRLKERLPFLDKSPSLIRLFDKLPAARAWVSQGPVPEYNPDRPRFLQA